MSAYNSNSLSLYMQCIRTESCPYSRTLTGPSKRGCIKLPRCKGHSKLSL